MVWLRRRAACWGPRQAHWGSWVGLAAGTSALAEPPICPAGLASGMARTLLPKWRFCAVPAPVMANVVRRWRWQPITSGSASGELAR